MNPAVSELTSDEPSLYEKFAAATQESVRLSAALRGFFLETDIDPSHRDAYGAYLKRRIRPAVAALIEQEDTDKLARMADLGWIDQRLTDEFLQMAQTQRKPAALVWLLRWKQSRFGFQDKDFSL